MYPDMRKKYTCFECNNAECSPGYPGSYEQPPEPPEAECHCDDIGFPNNVGEAFDWDPDVMPELCGHFHPIPVTCPECKKMFDHPGQDWPLWDMWGTAICSIACYLKYSQETETMIDEEFA